MPSVPKYMWLIIRPGLKPPCRNISGMARPNRQYRSAAMARQESTGLDMRRVASRIMTMSRKPMTRSVASGSPERLVMARKLKTR